MIEDREYLKRDLARIYTPHTRQAKSAMKKLREDINRCPELELHPCKLRKTLPLGSGPKT